MSADLDQNPSPADIAERERENQERKAREDAEQAQLPYKWTQTIRDVEVTAPIPSNLKGRDLDVVLTKNKIRVAIKGQEPLIEVCLFPIYLPTRLPRFSTAHSTYYLKDVPSSS
jgi:HSP20 family molecular chaperone IbpA